MRRGAALFLLMMLTGGCAGGSKKRLNVGPIVVLPPANNSTDVDAPKKVEEVLRASLIKKGYTVVDEEKTKRVLDELGITQGGQLKALRHKELAAALPADLYVYTWLERFGFQSAVAMSRRVVEMRMRLRRADGAEIFDRVEMGITTKAGADAAGDLILNTAGKLFKGIKNTTKKILPGKALKKTADFTDEIADVDLEQETREAVRRHLRRFPR